MLRSLITGQAIDNGDHDDDDESDVGKSDEGGESLTKGLLCYGHFIM